MRVEHFPRQVFIDEIFRPGWTSKQHVGFIGPTQLAGKTFTAFQLLGHVATPACPAACLVAKPADGTVDWWGKRLGYRETPAWPPPRRPFAGKPAGWLVWPKHSLTDPKKDQEHLRAVFSKTMTWNYGHGPNITFADELYRLSQIGLGDEIDAQLTGGSGMHAPLWYGTQRPAGSARVAVSSFAYNSPTWLFLSYDPDERNRKRYAEIGGVDPRLIEITTQNLPRHHWFVFHRDSGGICTIGA